MEEGEDSFLEEEVFIKVDVVEVMDTFELDLMDIRNQVNRIISMKINRSGQDGLMVQMGKENLVEENVQAIQVVRL